MTVWRGGVRHAGVRQTGVRRISVRRTGVRRTSVRRTGLPRAGLRRRTRWVVLVALMVLAGVQAAVPAGVAGATWATVPASSRDAVPTPRRAPDAAARAAPSSAAFGLSTSDRGLATGRPAPAVSGYALPLPGPMRVLRRFEPPPTPYSAGHRGVDLEARASSLVLAAGSGMVTFAGPVAGRGVVVIAHPDGIRTEYEPVASLVVAGQAVARGQPIGRLAGRHDDWPPGRCLHWGARRGDVYLDPLLLLRPLGPVRLLPWPR